MTNEPMPDLPEIRIQRGGPVWPKPRTRYVFFTAHRRGWRTWYVTASLKSEDFTPLGDKDFTTIAEIGPFSSGRDAHGAVAALNALAFDLFRAWSTHYGWGSK